MSRFAKGTKLRTAGVGIALAAVAVLFAACGGSGGPGVASIGSTTTTTTPATATQNTISAADYTKTVAYSECMRSHGVPNFPDPTSNGEFLSERGELNGQKVDFNSPQYVSANKACTHLLANGGQPTAAELQRLLTQALKFTQCLRQHGLPNMPDPVERDGGISQHFPRGVSPNSPVLRAATTACQSLAPVGP